MTPARRNWIVVSCQDVSPGNARAAIDSTRGNATGARRGPFGWWNPQNRLRCGTGMKNFFTSMLGSLVALMIFAAGCFFLVFGFFAVLATLGQAEKAGPVFERGSYLVLDLSANIVDAPPAV